MKHWRFIFTGPNDPFFNMALDEALLLSCEKGDSPPILRLYLWDSPAVSIGYSQPIEKTVDLKKCKRHHVQVVRRITGGRAVLHEDEITYCVCASSDFFPYLGMNTVQTYQKLSLALLESLHVLGIDAEWVKPSINLKSSSSPLVSSKPCFVSNSRYEVTVNGKKLIGSAQRRFSYRTDHIKKDSFIQHGSILMGKGKHSLAEFLPVHQRRICLWQKESSSEMMKQILEERSTNIREVLKRSVQIEEMISASKRGFGRVFGVRMEDSVVSEEELSSALTLKEEKYLSEEWNLRR
jgi:lipoate-protein ligase A